MNTDIGNKVEKLLHNSEFLSQAEETFSIHELQLLFKEYDVELSEYQVQSLVQMVVPDNKVELSAEDLDAVSGGWGKYIAGFAKAFKTGWNWGKKFFEWEEKMFG